MHSQFDHFPDGTEILSPQRESSHLKFYGAWYPPVPYTSIGFDFFVDGSLAIWPDRTTLYVKHTRAGKWFLVRPASAQFFTLGQQRRAYLDKASSELASSPVIGPQSPATRQVQGTPQVHGDIVAFNVSWSDAKLGRVSNPSSPAFTGEFATHQKARVSYEIEALNVDRKQINIRAQQKGPYSRSRLARLIADDIERAWAIAKARGETPWYNRAEARLEQAVLRDVRRTSRGGIRVALSFTPRRG
ncbi:hypothetical protein L226DRAFT_571871 [Lentinus tigrinus ALCF2SS1-7]|uniref:uncharacterized protein n=1 Tax=Lentinus tigrinus ALCF2SS1-7 TaxID=1328758 RepID=UPI001165DD77|nr:hypothetical protein L226DRAFT_571871 [Lentinus tigrinus ALCF2SS1-7]